jgi:hypothetical protein
VPTNIIIAPATIAPVLSRRAYAPAADAPTAAIVRPSAAVFADQSPPTTPSQLCRIAVAAAPPSTAPWRSGPPATPARS